jgi:hypothetical protein
LDNETLVRLHFDDADDTFRGAETVSDSAALKRHNDWRQLAWAHAQRRDEFAAAYS